MSHSYHQILPDYDKSWMFSATHNLPRSLSRVTCVRLALERAVFGDILQRNPSSLKAFVSPAVSPEMAREVASIHPLMGYSHPSINHFHEF